MIINSYRIFFLLLFLGVHGASAALVADIGGDYVNELAAPTNWEYRYANWTGTESGNLTPNLDVGDLGHRGFTLPYTPPDPNLLGIILGRKTEAGEDFKINNYSENNAVEGTDLIIQPGHYPGNLILARFTFSESMIITNGSIADISGSFRCLRMIAHDGLKVSILHNSTELWNAVRVAHFTQRNLTQAAGRFDLSEIAVQSGDTISFVVDARDSPDYDETALRGTISLVPEPAGYALLVGVGVLLFSVYLRRRA